MGTVLPACILYWPIEWPFRFRIGFTVTEEEMLTSYYYYMWGLISGGTAAVLDLSLHKWSNRFINNENILSLQPKLRLKHRKPNISDVSSAVRNTDLGMFCHRARPRTTPSPLESPLRHHTDAHRCRRSATKKQEVKSCRQRADQTHQSEARVFVCHTLIPVLVASLTASSSLSYFGLNVTVKAQSMIRPANRHQAERRASLSWRRWKNDYQLKLFCVINDSPDNRFSFCVVMNVNFRPPVM